MKQDMPRLKKAAQWMGVCLGIGTVAARADLPEGRILHYSFDSAATSGATVQDQAEAHPGVGSGLAWTASGRKGGGVELTGTASRIRVPHAEALAGTAGTFCVYFRAPSGDSVRRTILEKGGDAGYALQILGGDAAAGCGKLRFTMEGQSCTSNGDVADGTWRHAAAVYDGATLQLYVDGQAQKQTAPHTGAMDRGTGDLTLGVNASNPKSAEQDHSLNGRLDEVMFFPRALTSAEVQAVIADAPARFTRQQVERRLKELKELYDRGLLLPDFYDRQVKECESAL